MNEIKPIMIVVDSCLKVDSDNLEKKWLEIANTKKWPILNKNHTKHLENIRGYKKRKWESPRAKIPISVSRGVV
mgnify:FL=1